MKKKNKQTEKFISSEIKKQTYKNEDYQKAISFIVILVVVLALIGGLFYLNGKYVTKDMFQDNNKTTTEVEIDSRNITVDQMIKLNDKKALVLAYDKSDSSAEDLYTSLVYRYTGSTSVYMVDLSSKMNKKHFDLDKDENITLSSSFNVKKATLLTIENGRITSSTSDYEKIVKAFK